MSSIRAFLFCFGNGQAILPPVVNKAAQPKSVFSFFYLRAFVKKKVNKILPLHKYEVS